MNKRTAAILITAALLVGAVWFLQGTYGDELMRRAAGGGAWLLPVLVFASLLDSVNPCALSVLLISIAVLFGMGKSRKEVLILGSTYVFGVFLVYVLIGLGILQALTLFNVPNAVAKVGAVILIAAGALGVINDMFPKFPIRLAIPKSAHAKFAAQLQKASVPSAFVLGALVSLYEFPCTGGPYLLVLGLLHGQATFLKGFLYLLLYNFIFVLPLIVILIVAADEKLLEKVRGWKKAEMQGTKYWTGLAMILLGVIILLL